MNSLNIQGVFLLRISMFINHQYIFTGLAGRTVNIYVYLLTESMLLYKDYS